MRKLIASLFATTLLMAGFAGTASAQQTGLVNVEIGDITIEDVNVTAAVNVVAAVCANVTVKDVLVLLSETGGNTGDQTCDLRGPFDTTFNITNA